MSWIISTNEKNRPNQTNLRNKKDQKSQFIHHKNNQIKNHKNEFFFKQDHALV